MSKTTTTPARPTPGASIYHARHLRGLSQGDVATALTLDPKLFARIEGNQVPLDVDLAMRIAAYLALDVASLLPDHASQRYFEGTVYQQRYLVGDSRTMHEPWRWLEGLEGKRVRVHIEVLPEAKPEVKK